jgi:hypothetical protein
MEHGAVVRSLGRVDARSGHILNPDHVPPVVALADHREAPGLLEAADDLLRVPAAGPVDVARAEDGMRQS